MPLLLDQTLQAQVSRTYNVCIPDNPLQMAVPAIVVFHGGGQDAETMARRWGIDPANPTNPPPLPLSRYLLVFPEADPRLSDEWVHFKKGDSAFPTYDLLFVQQLLAAITDPIAVYPTGNVAVPTVTVDPNLIYAAGFSNGGGMAWQLMNSNLVSSFRGFAVVGKALDPEKALHYRQQLAPLLPASVPAIYVHGTADFGFRSPMTLQEVPLDTTLPANTVQEMLTRNLIPNNAPSVTTLVPGSTNITEVVVQLFQGGAEAFEYVTVVGGGHNWPSFGAAGNPPVATHFNATREIVEFWQNHAGLPL
ncbi:MAG: alpha/beta hydrolase family esterase [Egibacteraceae bacterium]